MSDRLATIASAIRTVAQEHPDAPEGIELYRWLWVRSDYHVVRVPIGTGMAWASEAPITPIAPPFPIAEIKRLVRLHVEGPGWPAWAGWDAGARVAAVFFADGGPAPKAAPVTEVISDADVRALTTDGAWKLFEECIWRLLDKLGEGEEWKRGQ